MSNDYHSNNHKFLQWAPDQARRYTKAPIANETWELHRDRIISLYIEQKMTLDEVIEMLESEGFAPS